MLLLWELLHWLLRLQQPESALHKEIQTAKFIRDWHKHSTELWTEQNKVDNEIVNELADLRQAVTFSGDLLKILKEQIKLKCDWNVTSYFIALLKFNESKYDWEKVKMYLMGHPNSS